MEDGTEKVRNTHIFIFIKVISKVNLKMEKKKEEKNSYVFKIITEFSFEISIIKITL